MRCFHPLHTNHVTLQFFGIIAWKLTNSPLELHHSIAKLNYVVGKLVWEILICVSFAPWNCCCSLCSLLTLADSCCQDTGCWYRLCSSAYGALQKCLWLWLWLWSSWLRLSQDQGYFQFLVISYCGQLTGSNCAHVLHVGIGVGGHYDDYGFDDDINWLVWQCPCILQLASLGPTQPFVLDRMWNV